MDKVVGVMTPMSNSPRDGPFKKCVAVLLLVRVLEMAHVRIHARTHVRTHIRAKLDMARSNLIGRLAGPIRSR